MNIQKNKESHGVKKLILKGAILGIENAIIGSLIFVLMDEIVGSINTNLIENINTPTTLSDIVSTIGALLFFAVLGIILAFVPATLSGALLSYCLYRGREKINLSKKFAIVIGIVVGALSVQLVCIPILVLEHWEISNYHHGDFSVFVIRAIEATISAALVGGFTAKQLWSYLEKNYSALTRKIEKV